MRMFNSAYNQQSSNNRGHGSGPNNNPRALLGSGNTYWSGANRNEDVSASSAGGASGSRQHQRSDLNGLGSSSSGNGRSAKAMTWASVASQPTVKPIKAHSLRSKMASNSSSGSSSLTPFSSSGGKSLPPPIVTGPMSSVPPPVVQAVTHAPPAVPVLMSRESVSDQPSLFSLPSNSSAPANVPHPLQGSKNLGQNSSMSDDRKLQYNNGRDDGYNRFNTDNSNRSAAGASSGHSATSSWQPLHYRNFPGNENSRPPETLSQRPPERDVHVNGNRQISQDSQARRDLRNDVRPVLNSKLSSSSSPSSSGTSSSIRSTASSLTSDRTDRESSESSSLTGNESVTKSLTALKLEPVVKVDKIDEILHQFNPEQFDLNPINARFFVIKSYSEDDIHRSIKYSIWCSTDHGNKRLDIAYKEQQSTTGGPVYLFYSVNGSGHFCGMAQMVSAVDYNSTVSVWAQDKWKGQFKVKWIYVKDVPNAQLRHIRLENNENKPVTNSRDTQEVPSDKGKQVLQIIHSYSHSTSIFDDFMHYEKRQEEESIHRKGDDVIVPPSGHSSHNREREARQQNGGPSREDYGGDHRPPYHNNNQRGYERPQYDQNHSRENFRGGVQGHNNGFQRGDNYFRGPHRDHQDSRGGYNQQRDAGYSHQQREYQPRDSRGFHQREDRPAPDKSLNQRDIPQRGDGNRRQLDPW